VHGVGASAQSSYGSLLKPLAEDFAVVAPDYSEWSAAASVSPSLKLDQLVDQHVDAAIRAGGETFAVAGHSLGSMLAIRTAVRHPDRVSALVLTAGFARADTSMRTKMQVWRALLLSHRDLVSRYVMSIMLSDRYISAMTDDQFEGFAELIDLTLGDGHTEQLGLALDLDLRSDLDKVRVPTLVIATNADQLVPPRMAAELLRGIPGARLADLECGHQPTLECAPQWMQLVKDFLLV
jgi:pimeloyl-ACP methyl ester carboxylesterase